MLHMAMEGSDSIVYGSTDYVDASGRFIFSFSLSEGVCGSEDPPRWKHAL